MPSVNIDTLKFPSGRSVRDAKKDAKRLAKKLNIPLHQAQDLTPQKNNLPSPWSESLELLKPQASSTQSDTKNQWRELSTLLFNALGDVYGDSQNYDHIAKCCIEHFDTNGSFIDAELDRWKRPSKERFTLQIASRGLYEDLTHAQLDRLVSALYSFGAIGSSGMSEIDVIPAHHVRNAEADITNQIWLLNLDAEKYNSANDTVTSFDHGYSIYGYITTYGDGCFRYEVREFNGPLYGAPIKDNEAFILSKLDHFVTVLKSVGFDEVCVCDNIFKWKSELKSRLIDHNFRHTSFGLTTWDVL